MKEHAKYIKGLPVEQQDAIINYTGSDYSKINRALRNGRSMGKKLLRLRNVWQKRLTENWDRT
ncbi:ADP-ribosyltransferase [Lacticaseibacillus saniviri]|uniref:ADP-ribosyltransferase n=1 Tax=Lacticaseibacillus saniviri TaxID=931533 RepID=UPI0012E1325E